MMSLLVGGLDVYASDSSRRQNSSPVVIRLIIASDLDLMRH
jgi:hypothetical protein